MTKEDFEELRDELVDKYYAEDAICKSDLFELLDAYDKLLEKAHNSDYECHRDEFENIMCDIESAFHANATTCKSILDKSLHSIKSYIEKHFA